MDENQNAVPPRPPIGIAAGSTHQQFLAETPASQEEMPFYKAAMAKAELAQAMEISAVAPYSTVSEILQKKKAQLEYELKVVNDALDSVNDALDKARQLEGPRGQ